MQPLRPAPRSSILRNTLAVVMAGGEGRRLGPLTRSHAKPALPIAGRYRNIDFSLSNCVNSGIRRVGLLTQYKAHSLIQHVHGAWSFLCRDLGEFIELWPAQRRTGEGWYAGTADAVYQNLDTIDEHRPEHVLILAGDHIYKMDYLPMLEAHIRASADATIGCIEVPTNEAHQFGVLATDASGRVVKFCEKPAEPRSAPGRPDRALVSMGIYVFSRAALVNALAADAQNPHSKHDFGTDIIPALVENGRVQAYEFLDQVTGEAGYWRDVGTLHSYWQANMDLLSDPPPLDLYDDAWPILTGGAQGAPVTIAPGGEVKSSMIGAGCHVAGTVDHSVIFDRARIGRHAAVKHSLILPGATIGRGCSIQGAIVDAGCRVPDGAIVGDHNVDIGSQGGALGQIELVTAQSLAARASAHSRQRNVA